MSGFFSPALAIADFRAALARCGRPAYPAKAWHRALADADQHDLMRLLAARYRKLDKARASVRYVDRIYASALPHMNGQVLHWQAEEGASRRLPGWKKAS